MVKKEICRTTCNFYFLGAAFLALTTLGLATFGLAALASFDTCQ